MIGHSEIQTEGRLNHEIFEDIQKVTARFIEEVAQHEKMVDGKSEVHDVDEDMKAFHSEQYLTKNIRIIPIGIDDDMSMRGGEEHEEEQKFHSDAQHDVEKLREKVREMYDNYIERVEK